MHKLKVWFWVQYFRLNPWHARRLDSIMQAELETLLRDDEDRRAEEELYNMFLNQEISPEEYFAP